MIMFFSQHRSPFWVPKFVIADSSEVPSVEMEPPQPDSDCQTIRATFFRIIRNVATRIMRMTIGLMISNTSMPLRQFRESANFAHHRTLLEDNGVDGDDLYLMGRSAEIIRSPTPFSAQLSTVLASPIEFRRKSTPPGIRITRFGFS